MYVRDMDVLTPDERVVILRKTILTNHYALGASSWALDTGDE
jgi:hypothetical protein